MGYNIAEFPTDENRPSAITAETSSLAAAVWKRFRKHPGAIGGSIVLILVILLVIFAPLSPYDPELSTMTERYQPPALQHPMGTDALGRDLFTRVLYGGRISLTVGMLVVFISVSIGVPIGAIAGYYGGKLDSVLMRITDTFLSLPSFLVLILRAPSCVKWNCPSSRRTTC